MSDSLAELMGENGALARQLPGYKPRAAQFQMAEGIFRALRGVTTLVVEAETGTGKTFAYLLPSFLHNGKIVISTGTKNLQDQLFFKDIPILSKATGKSRSVALLKGRRNYLCLHRLELYSQPSMQRGEFTQYWPLIRQWAKRTQTGDIGEIADVPSELPIWHAATSTAENCLGTECPCWRRCFVAVARRKAQDADIVVVNHHLFFADVSLKDGGFGEILPDVDALVFDEAHQLAEVATQYFGESVSSRQLSALLSDLRAECSANAAEVYPEIGILAQNIEMAIRQARLNLDSNGPRITLDKVLAQFGNRHGLDEVLHHLTLLAKRIEAMRDRSEGLGKCSQRLHDSIETWKKIIAPQPGYAQYLNITRFSFSLVMEPVDVAEKFGSLLAARSRTWIFTSATLAVADTFDHFMRQLGIKQAETMRLSSPFDYKNSALFYVPANMPDPRESGYTRALISATLPLVEQIPGGAFFLFTSHRALEEAHTLIATRSRRKLLVQGTQSRRVLLDEFRKSGDAILLGAQSFWEGVDVRGAALSCVIIDKLPFVSPDDPLLRAKIEQARNDGRNGFTDIQLPSAMLTLRQGVGRLIRDESDRGLLIIGDPRIYQKSYSRTLLSALPPMRSTRDEREVTEFIANCLQ